MRPLGEQDPRSAGPFRLLAELDEDETGRLMLGHRNGDVFLIKLVHPHIAEGDGFRDRLRKELSSRRRYTRNVPVAGRDADAAVPWVALEYVPGAFLESSLTERRVFTENDLLRLATGLVSALKKLHGNGLVHGELTPAAVRLTGAEPLLIDFGVARAVGRHSPADDVHALGVLLESASRRPLPASVRRIVAARKVSAAKRPTAATLLKMMEKPLDLSWPRVVHELAHEEVDEATTVIVRAGNPSGLAGWVRRTRDTVDRWPDAPPRRIRRETPPPAVIDDWPAHQNSIYQERKEPRFVRKRPKRRADPAERSEQLSEEGKRNRAKPLERFGEGALVLSTAAFAGWAAGQLVFGGAEVTEFPTRVTRGSVREPDDTMFALVPFTWGTVGLTMGVACAVLLLLIGRPRSRTPVWTIAITLSLTPFVLWAANAMAGLEVKVVTDFSGYLLVLVLFPFALAGGVYAAARKLFPGRTFLQWISTVLIAVLAIENLSGHANFGWVGVVIADAVRIDVVTVLAAAIAGSVAYRKLRPAE